MDLIFHKRGNKVFKYEIVNTQEDRKNRKFLKSKRTYKLAKTVKEYSGDIRRHSFEYKLLGEE